MLKAIDAALHILNVYSIELPPGECYPTEPFGEIGPDEFVTETIKALNDARVQDHVLQTELEFFKEYAEHLESQLTKTTDELLDNLD